MNEYFVLDGEYHIAEGNSTLCGLSVTHSNQDPVSSDIDYDRDHDCEECFEKSNIVELDNSLKSGKGEEK